MGAGGGSVIIGANNRNTNEGAHVVNNRLLVSSTGGGGGGDVNIAEVGGVPVGGPSVPINDAGGSITIDGFISILNFPAVQVVSGTVTDNTEVTEGDAVPVSPDLIPIAAERKDTPAALPEADGEWVHLRTDANGALWVRPMSLILPLSGSTDGEAFGITATTSGTAQTLHTAGPGVDQVHIVASNTNQINQTVTLIWGTFEKDFNIPSNDSRVIAVGDAISNAKVIQVYASVGVNLVTLTGYVERQS